MKTHELKSHQFDRKLEKLLRGYVADFLAGNAAGRILDEMLRKGGSRHEAAHISSHLRTHNIDRRGGIRRHGFEHEEMLEYTNWFAKVYAVNVIRRCSLTMRSQASAAKLITVRVRIRQKR